MTGKFLAARMKEITAKVKNRGLSWAAERFFSKQKESCKYVLDEWAHVVKDIGNAGIPYAWANTQVQRRFNALLKEAYHYSTLREKAPYPLHTHIEVTSLCNLQCRMCPRLTMQRAQGTMTVEAFKRIIDELSRVHIPNTLFMHFTGEPLVNPQLHLMIKYAKEKGLPWIKFNTNACLLTEDRAKEILQSGLDCLVCAVEMSEEEENKLRPGADYNAVVKNVQRFMRLKKEMKVQKPLVKLQMLVTRTNKHLTNAAYRYWRDIVDRVDFHPMHTVGGRVEDLGATKLKRAHCEQVWVSLVFLWNGDVVPCCLDHDAALRIGNIFERPLEEIWNHPKMSLLRQEDESGRFSNPICKKCMQEGIDY